MGVEGGGRIGEDLVERAPRGGRLPSVGIEPLALNPPISDNAPGGASHRFSPGPAPVQAHPLATHGPLGEVGVPIHEPRRDQAVREFSQSGPGCRGRALDVGKRANRLDAAIGPADRVGWTAGPQHRPDPQKSFQHSFQIAVVWITRRLGDDSPRVADLAFDHW